MTRKEKFVLFESSLAFKEGGRVCEPGGPEEALIDTKITNYSNDCDGGAGLFLSGKLRVQESTYASGAFFLTETSRDVVNHDNSDLLIFFE